MSVPISFEFFPPNTPVGSEKLKTVVADLAAVRPEFFSGPASTAPVVVEVAPVVPQRSEPGRAPAVPRIDETQPHHPRDALRPLCPFA